MLVELSLRPHRNVLSGGHGKGARGQPGDTGGEQPVRVGAGACDTEDEACIRDQPVVDAEHGSAKVAAAAQIAMAQFHCATCAGGCVAGIVRLRRAVDGHSAHLHRCEDWLHPARTQPVDQPRDQPGARVGQVGRWRRMPARRQLCAPDRSLRLRFDRQPLEQFGACGTGLGLRARTVEIDRTLFLVPAGKRIHGCASANAARRTSTRLRLAPRSL